MEDYGWMSFKSLRFTSRKGLFKGLSALPTGSLNGKGILSWNCSSENIKGKLWSRVARLAHAQLVWRVFLTATDAVFVGSVSCTEGAWWKTATNIGKWLKWVLKSAKCQHMRPNPTDQAIFMSILKLFLLVQHRASLHSTSYKHLAQHILLTVSSDVFIINHPIQHGALPPSATKQVTSWSRPTGYTF